MRRYFRRVWLRLLIGSLAGIAMNTTVVLPAILLGSLSTRPTPSREAGAT
jgi:hypothetical protein